MRMQSSQWLQALASSLSSYRSSEAELEGPVHGVMQSRDEDSPIRDRGLICRW